MTKNPCTGSELLAKLLGIAIELTLKCVSIALKAAGAVALVVALVCVVVDHMTHLGMLVGLGLGCLLGPLRIAGVDFRQWFREPGAPSELGDDSWIGLMRGGCHALGAAGLLALLVFVVIIWRTDPGSCAVVAAPWQIEIWINGKLASLVASLVAWLGETRVGSTLGALLATCSGFWSFAKVLVGVLVGAAVPHAAIEGTWRLGLKLVPPPSRPVEYLAPQSPPRLRRKVPHDGRRRLIVCCDGTWNWPDGVNETNVIRLVRAIKPAHEGVAQIVHYHQGVGTGDFVDRIVGGGAGVGLAASVKACYGFLVDNYEEGDEIFLFGFSRGAYVARALGGVIGTVGLMRKAEMTRFTQMWNWYWQKERVPHQLDEIAPRRHQDIEIDCIGVWDTVGALGIPGSRFCASAYEFFQAELGPHVRHAFQALAIDEQRGNFQGAVWVPYDAQRERSPEARALAARHLAEACDPNADLQVIKQVWFPGVHSNVGGGYPKHGMSDTTFVWMLAQIRGLLDLNDDCIAAVLDSCEQEQYPGGQLEDSRSGGWKWAFCPVPRPVCVISATELVHQSACGRSQTAPPLVAAKDVYKKQGRCNWLAAMGDPTEAAPSLGVRRSGTESELAGLPRPAAPIGRDIPPMQDFCSRVLAPLRPQGG